MSEFAPREHAPERAPVPSRPYHAPSPVYQPDHVPPAVTHADPAPVLLPEPARPPLKLHPTAPAPAPAPIPSVYAPQAPLVIPHAYTQLRTLLARDPGVPLDPQTLARMEANLRVPLGDIRIHDDPGAWMMCAHLAALAHTAGTHIFFAKGAYEPGTVRGRNLLGHQLARAVAWRTEQQAAEATEAVHPAAAPAQPVAAQPHEALHQPPVAAHAPVAAAPQTQRVEDDRATIVGELTRLAAQPESGYALFTVLLGADPLAGRAVPRPADEDLAADILRFVPGGMSLLATLSANGGVARFVATMTDAAHLGRVLTPTLSASLSTDLAAFLRDPAAWLRPRQGLEWAPSASPQSQADGFFQLDIQPRLTTIHQVAQALGPGVARDAGASAAAPTAVSAPHKHGGGGAHPSGGSHPPTGAEADAIADVRSHLHWPAPVVQALVTLNDRPAALLADAPPDHATRFALHLGGQVLPLAQAPAGAVYWAMQDILAAGPTGDNPGAAGSLLAALAGAVQRDLAAVAKLPGQFLDALTAEGKTLLRTLLGPQVIAELDRAGDVVGAILADPVGFFAHLATALKDGFDGFLARLPDHLKSGLMAWLGQTLGALSIELPKTFDLAGVASVALQVLTLTYDHVRALLVQALGADGEARVEAMERGYGFLTQLAAPGGLAATWAQVQQVAGASAGDLMGPIIGGVTAWVGQRLAASVAEHLVTLCSGVGSIAAAVQSIYNAVTFFVSNRDAIAALADRVLGVVATIATGKAADLARLGQTIEATMAGMLPLLIDFLARQFGLGDVGQRLHQLIEDARAPITRVEQQLVAFLARQAHRFPARSASQGHGGTAGAGGGGQVEPGDFPRATFESDEGRHTVWVNAAGESPVPMMSSTPTALTEVLAEVVARGLRTDVDADMVQARELVAQMVGLARAITRERRAGGDAHAIRSYYQALLKKEQRLATLLKAMFGNKPLGAYDKRYELEGLVSTYGNLPEQRRDRMTGDHQPQAEILKHVAAIPGTVSRLLFDGRFILQVIAGKHVDGGYAINLQEDRHQLGRTFGRVPSAARVAVNTAVAAKTTDDDKRAAAIDVLRDELASDVQAMRRVANLPDDHPKAWGDINALPNLSTTGKKRLIRKVRGQILRGEARIAAQNLDRLNYPTP